MADTNRASHVPDTFEAQIIAAYNNPTPSNGGGDPFVDHPLAVEGDQFLTTSASLPSLRAQRADDTADPNSLLPPVHNADAIFPAHNSNLNLNTEDNIDRTLLPPPPILSERSSLTVLGSNDLDPLAPVKESQLALPASTYADERVSEGIPGQLGETGKKKRSKLFWIGVGLGVVVLLSLVVFLAVFFGVVKKSSSASASSSSPSSSSGGGGGGTTGGGTGGGHGGSTSAITGGDGSTVTMDNGTTFTYRNSFGGFWVSDPTNPFNNNARPNSWTPPLNTSWTWGKDRVYGVNLGGWLVMEPFITPSYYQKYTGAVDEFTLSTLMSADTGTGGGLQQLETHYETFITEQDIAEIAGAGINWVRVPIAFWAIETWTGEPFLARTSWKYFLRFLGWARKYGLRVCLDLHAVPGSQNGYNHSGMLKVINFMSGNMGLANAQRTLDYIRVLTEFITQPEYQDLIPIFGIVNEPTAGTAALSNFYLEAHTLIRSITGLGAGHGPYIAMHAAFNGAGEWAGFLQGADRMILDQHPYFAFGGVNTSPVNTTGPTGQPGGTWPALACNTFGQPTEDARTSFGVTIAGEFSAAPNDCGLFMVGVGVVSPHPQCPEYDDWPNYSAEMKAGLLNMVLATMDALGDWFFWTWKIGPDQTGKISSPLWSYRLGLENGWIPKDPRTAQGKCASLNVSINPFSGDYLPWQTGSVPSTIPDASSVKYPWPPATMTNADVSVSLLPTYTNTGPVITMPVPTTFTSAPSKVTSGFDGWFDQADTAGGVITVKGCVYPNEYSPTFAVVPTAACTGA